MDDLESQQHRRSLKSHLPLDGLPIFDEVKYIHIARDGRDVCMSYHNHVANRSEEHTSELQSLMRISYAVFCLKKKNNQVTHKIYIEITQTTTTKNYLDT